MEQERPSLIKIPQTASEGKIQPKVGFIHFILYDPAHVSVKVMAMDKSEVEKCEGEGEECHCKMKP